MDDNDWSDYNAYKYILDRNYELIGYSNSKQDKMAYGRMAKKKNVFELC